MLLVFADDWGRHPSSCQHLVRQLLPRHRVVWVNTIGTRAPALNLATLQRGLGKLRQWAGRRSQPVADPNPHVISPVMWPWLRGRFDTRIAPATFVRAGAFSLCLGIASVTLLVWESIPVLVGVLGWGFAGFGMGMIYSSLSLLTLQLSAPAEQGKNSSALQVAEALTVAVVLALAAPAGAQERLKLTLEQEHVIKELLKDTKIDTTQLPKRPEAGSELPQDVNPQPMPREIGQRVPQVRSHRVLVTADAIVIVDPKDNKVAEVIELQRTSGGSGKD